MLERRIMRQKDLRVINILMSNKNLGKKLSDEKTDEDSPSKNSAGTGNHLICAKITSPLCKYAYETEKKNLACHHESCLSATTKLKNKIKIINFSMVFLSVFLPPPYHHQFHSYGLDKNHYNLFFAYFTRLRYHQLYFCVLVVVFAFHLST
jgi:hypothetical protein